MMFLFGWQAALMMVMVLSVSTTMFSTAQLRWGDWTVGGQRGLLCMVDFSEAIVSLYYNNWQT